MTEILTTKEEQELAVSNLRTLKDHAGWQLLVKIVEENMRVLQDQILNGFEDETKDMIDRKRDKLRAYKDIIETPDSMIARLTNHDPIKKEEDPYDTIETLKKQRDNS